MAIRAVQEEEKPRLRLLPITDPQPETPVYPKPKPEKPVREKRVVAFPTAETVAILSLLLKVCAARVILMFAGIGAFVLALIASQHPSVNSIIATAIYDVSVFGPCLYLAIRRE
jgi:hypothetical protein